MRGKTMQHLVPTFEVASRHLAEKAPALSYSVSGIFAGTSALLGDLLNAGVGAFGVLGTLVVTVYFKWRDDKRKERESQEAIRADRAKRKSYEHMREGDTGSHTHERKE